MERTPPLLSEAAVGHFMREGVLEGIGRFREKGCLIEELCGLQVSQALREVCFGALGNGLQQRKEDIPAVHRGFLEEVFLRRGSRSMRAASTACTVAGTCRLCGAAARP
jgi:hypothetical protein